MAWTFIVFAILAFPLAFPLTSQAEPSGIKYTDVTDSSFTGHWAEPTKDPQIDGAQGAPAGETKGAMKEATMSVKNCHWMHPPGIALGKDLCGTEGEGHDTCQGEVACDMTVGSGKIHEDVTGISFTVICPLKKDDGGKKLCMSPARCMSDETINTEEDDYNYKDETGKTRPFKDDFDAYIEKHLGGAKTTN